MRVRDPKGEQWRVRRRWLPWKRRIRPSPELADGLGSLGDDPISAFIGTVVAAIVIVVVGALLIELAILLVILPFVLLARAFSSLPWGIEIDRRPAKKRIGGWEAVREIRVRGYRASKAQVPLTAGRLQEGMDLTVAVAVPHEGDAAATQVGDRGPAR